jgi:hypothetical protein
VPTVRVTCPECDFSFAIADTRVGGLIACRDCKAEFRVEFAEDEGDAAEAAPDTRRDRDERPSRSPARTRSRPDVDSEPETWKTDLPIRSPMPLLIILVCLQVLVAGFLLINWLVPASSNSGRPTNSYYRSDTVAPKTVPSTPNTRR